jgi:hypothetical protein
MSTLAAWDWVMVVVGALLLGAGAAAIWGERVRSALGRAARRDAPNVARADGVSRLTDPRVRFSESTRLSIGVVLVLLGYNVAAWGLPVAWGLPKVPRQTWPWFIAFCVVWVVGSLLLDSRERSDGPGGPDGSGVDDRTDRDPN